MIFHVVLMLFCQIVVFAGAWYLMLFSVEERFECSLLGLMRPFFREDMNLCY